MNEKLESFHISTSTAMIMARMNSAWQHHKHNGFCTDEAVITAISATPYWYSAHKSTSCCTWCFGKAVHAVLTGSVLTNKRPVNSLQHTRAKPRK